MQYKSVEHYLTATSIGCRNFITLPRYFLYTSPRDDFLLVIINSDQSIFILS